MLYIGLRDIIAYNMYIFGNNLHKNTTTLLLPNNQSKNFLRSCLQEENTNFQGDLAEIITDDLRGFSKNYNELNNILNKEEYTPRINFKDSYLLIVDTLRNLDSETTIPETEDDSSPDFETSTETIDTSEIPINLTVQIQALKEMIKEIRDSFNNLKNIINKGSNHLRNVEENIIDYSFDSLDSFDCGFLKNDINLLYNSLYDLSVQSIILCVLSCCIGFFGELLIYFYLLVMYHYDNDVFKESQLNKNRARNKNKLYKSNINLENSSKNEFLDKSKPGDIKKFNQKLDNYFSSN